MASGRVTQINDCHMIPVKLFRNAAIGTKQVPFRIRRDKTHPRGTCIFQIGIQKVCRFPHTGSTNHQHMHIAFIYISRHFISVPTAPHKQSLSSREIVSLPPFLCPIWHCLKGILNLFFRRKSRCPVLAIPHLF